jgi:hypothetical protein
MVDGSTDVVGCGKELEIFMLRIELYQLTCSLELLIDWAEISTYHLPALAMHLARRSRRG